MPDQDSYPLATATRKAYPGKFDTLSDADLDKAVRKAYPTLATKFPASASPSLFKRVTAAVSSAAADVAPIAQRAGTAVLHSLPVVGGVVGEAFGGPGGAALGQAGGQGLENVITQAPQIPGAVRDVVRNVTQAPTTSPQKPGATSSVRDRVRTLGATMEGAREGMSSGAADMASAAAVGAGSTLLGQGANRVLTGAAKKLMTFELGPIAKRTLQQYHTTLPQIVTSLLDAGVNITERGADRIATLLDMGEEETSHLVGAIQRKGTAKDLLGPVKEVAEDYKAARNALPRGPARDLTKYAREFLQTHPGAMDGPAIQEFKRGNYALEKTQYVRERPTLESQFRMATARGARQFLEQAAKDEGLGDLAALNDTQRQRLAAQAAVGESLLRKGKAPTLYEATWLLSHPTAGIVGAAKHLGIPVGSLTARLLYQLPIRGLNSTVARTLLTGLTSQESPSAPGAGDAGSSGSGE